MVDLIFLGIHFLVFVVVLVNIRLKSTAASNLAIISTFLVLSYLSFVRFNYSFFRRAVVAGLITLAVWAPYEKLWDLITGGWGIYTATVWFSILGIPFYTLLIGALAFTYSTYVALRLDSAKLNPRLVCVLSGLSGFFLGVIGENVYALGGFWDYYDVRVMVWDVAAHVPISYLLGFALAPLAFRKFRTFTATQIVLIVILVASTVFKRILG